MSGDFHPLDVPEFVEWMRDRDVSDFHYGLNDTRWGEAYNDYLEEIDDAMSDV